MPDPSAQWRELLEGDPGIEDTVSILETLAESDDTAVGPGLAGACDAVIDSLLVSDDESIRPQLLEPLLALLERSRRVTPKESLLGGLGEVGCATLLAAADDGDEPGPVLADWIPAVVGAGARLRDRDRISYALACAAHRFDDPVCELLDAEPMPYAPDAEFGPDAGSYARYLVSAATADAPAEEYGGAWTSFVAFFPTRLETGGLTFKDLVFAGYGTYDRIFGYETHEIFSGIHEFVRQVAVL